MGQPIGVGETKTIRSLMKGIYSVAKMAVARP